MSVPAVLAVFSGFLGLAVLFLLGVEAFRRIRSLARAVARSGERLATAGLPPPEPGQSGDDAGANVR